MGWEGPLPAPALSGSVATYAEVKPGIDLNVEATVHGVESFYIVKNRDAATHVKELTVPITGADVSDHDLAPNGALALYDEDRNLIAASPPPLMWDSRTDPSTGEPTTVRPMASDAEERDAAAGPASVNADFDSGVNLTITPDAKFLADPKTVYPVTIDPQINYDDPSWDTWVRQGTTTDLSTTDNLGIGLWAGGVDRAFVNFVVDALKGKHITAATTGFYNFKSTGCVNSNWEIWSVNGSNTSTRWTSQPTWKTREGTSTATAGGPNNCTSPGWIWINSTTFFQRQADELRGVAYMGVRATDETDVNSGKQFYSQNYGDTSKSPRAVVTYGDNSVLKSRRTDTSSVCTTGAARPVIDRVTPELSATFSDTDSTTVNATFEYGTLGGATLGTETVTGTAISSPVSIIVPEDTMFSGQTYRWRIRTTDDPNSSLAWSTWCEFTIQANFAGPSIVPAASDFDGYVPPASPTWPVDTVPEPAGNAFIPGVDDQPAYVPTPDTGVVAADPTSDESDVEEATVVSAEDVGDDTAGDRPMVATSTTTSPPGTCPASSATGPNVSFGCIENMSAANASAQSTAVSIDAAELSDNGEVSATATRTAVGRLGNTPLPSKCKGANKVWVVDRFSACAYVPWRHTLYTRTNNVVRMDGWVEYETHTYTRTSPTSGTYDIHVYLHILRKWGSVAGLVAANKSVHCNKACSPRIQKSQGSMAKLGNWIQFSATNRPPFATGKRAEREFYTDWEIVAPGYPTTSMSTESATIRCDQALKGSDSKGCVIGKYIPKFKISKSGPYRDIANHIYAAQASGLPGKAGRGVLIGEEGTGNALTRLYDNNARNKNGSKACPSGLRSKYPWVPVPASKTCDEYPFRSTYQGAWTASAMDNPRTFDKFCYLPQDSDYGPAGYSHCFVDGTQNGRAGTELGNFYGRNNYGSGKVGQRILDRDPFFVQVTS